MSKVVHGATIPIVWKTVNGGRLPVASYEHVEAFLTRVAPESLLEGENPDEDNVYARLITGIPVPGTPYHVRQGILHGDLLVAIGVTTANPSKDLVVELRTFLNQNEVGSRVRDLSKVHYAE